MAWEPVTRPMPPEAEPTPPADTPPADAPDHLAPLRAFYHRNRVALWAAGIVLPVLVVAVGLVVRPELFWDRFLWEHIWGSAVADATQRGVATHNGITATEDYTLVSEVVYGAIMAAALYGIYVHVIQRFKVQVDAWFVAAILPFILFGPVSRTLEDTSMFCRPGGPGLCDPTVFAYLFISPFLYAVIAALVLVFMVAGAMLDRSAAPNRTKTLFMAGLLLGIAALYGVVHTTVAGEFRALAHPAVVFGSALLGLAVFHLAQERGANGVNRSLAAGGLLFLLPGVWMIGTWLAGSPWSGTILGRMHVDAIPVIMGLPLLVALAVYGAGKALSARDARFLAYTVPLNLGLFYGHMLDGFASFVAICSNAASTVCNGATIFGLSLPDYGEKHPVSAVLLTYLDGWLFPIIKFCLVVGIVWVLDVEYRKDLEKERNLGGLVKMAILILGLAPGLRDLLRLIMGT